MKPDSRKCTWSLLSEREELQPNIMFTPTALKWVRAMIQEHDGEVGFLGLVEEVEGAFVITEIFYPKHDLVTAGTCEISADGEVEIAQRLIDENRPEDIARVRFWGHSHHTMGTTPSGQDDTQALEKMVQNGAYFIRAIGNKNHELSVSFFDHEKQVKFENVKWSVLRNFDSMMDGVISAVNMESNNKEKVAAVRSAVSTKVDFTDDEYKAIVAQVKELKDKQLPKSPARRSVHRFQGSGRGQFAGPGYQPDIFEGDFEPPYGTYPGHEPYSWTPSGRGVNPNRGNVRNHVDRTVRDHLGGGVNGKRINGKDTKPLLDDQEIESVIDAVWEGEDVL